MTSIAILTAHSRFPWLRQIPGGGDTLDGVRFTLGEVADDCALLVVYEDLAEAVVTRVPRERLLLILSEPPGIKRYRQGFLEQFGTVLGPVPVPGYSGRVLASQPALPWFYGVAFEPSGLVAAETADTLAAIAPPEKIEALSVVLSKKSQLPKHRARLAFVEALERRIGARLQVFGRGFRDIRDKAEAISPYAYHLVLENNDLDHFWTEKTADAYLGWALPLFSGCANIGAYFPQDSFEALDIADTGRAIAEVEALLEARPHAARLGAIAEARRRVLGPYNLFPVLHGLARSDDIALAPARGGVELVTPNRAHAPMARVRSTFKSLFRGPASGRNPS